MKKCEKCGTKAQSKFCPNCGGEMKNFIQRISNEKSDVWVRILKLTALIEAAIILFVAIFLIIGAIFNPWDAGSFIVLAVVALIICIAGFVMNMVIVNALYNLQAIRKAVTNEEKTRVYISPEQMANFNDKKNI